MSAGAYTTVDATPDAPHRADTVILGSEFIAFVARADAPEDAHAWVHSIRAARSDASHVCWAYQIGGAYRFNDDGEPGGTAGGPILRAIGGQGLDHVCVAVVRYYGGTKLGTGGLVRAYGNTAAEGLRTAPRLEIRPRVSVQASVPFAEVGTLYHLLGGFDLDRGEETYGQDGLTLPLRLYPEDLEPLALALSEATRGSGEVTPVAVPAGPSGEG
ncbi:IMPACT family protein [Deinococcus altitudinis]|uniref:IMPACT family protein n=1 Tax=Deinococcus altitudinis TaxID=468914 RepID=UPI003891ED54